MNQWGNQNGCFPGLAEQYASQQVHMKARMEQQTLYRSENSTFSSLLDILTSHRASDKEDAVETLRRLIRERDQFREAEDVAKFRIMCLADTNGLLMHQLQEMKHRK